MGIFMEKIRLTENSRKCLLVGVIVFAVYFVMKYISPVLSPFILAFLVVGAINPFVTRLHGKIRLKKSILTGFVLLLSGAILVLFLWFLWVGMVSGEKNLAEQLSGFEEELFSIIQSCCDGMSARLGFDGIVVENFVLEQLSVLSDNFEVNIFPAIMGKSVDFVKILAGIGSYLVVFVIAVLLMIKDYDKVMNRLISEEALKGFLEVCVKVVVYIKTFIKAQFVILCIISTICALTLWICGIKGGVVYGVITGFMDMLPFVGTGIMLMPLAFFLFLRGNYVKALVCVCLYVVCALVREFLEPKLIGSKVGVWPVGILLGVFAGLKLFGIGGIIKGPLSLVIICEVCKYLWKREE